MRYVTSYTLLILALAVTLQAKPKPMLIHSVPAQYSTEAIKRNVNGIVKLAVIVEADGTVGDVTVIKRLGFGLEAEAYRAVKQYKFEPTGKSYRYTVEFRFNRKDVK